MFSLIYGCYKCMVARTEYYILLLGLDNAGKTTLLERVNVICGSKKEALPPGRISPTVGLNIGRVDVGRDRLILWDLGGQQGLRTIWEKYYSETNAVLFVVDSADVDHLHKAKDVFDEIWAEKQLKKLPILVFVNKQDLPEAQSPEHISTLFGLYRRKSKQHDFHVQPVCALSGEGIKEGLYWLVDSLHSKE